MKQQPGEARLNSKAMRRSMRNHQGRANSIRKVGWQIVLVAVLFRVISSSTAAEPEKIADSALQQIGALEQEKLSRSETHRKLDSQFVFKLKEEKAQLVAPGLTKFQSQVEFAANGRVLVDI